MDASEGQQRRLIIKEMVLENFKSYAGEQRVGPFHKVGTSSMGGNSKVVLCRRQTEAFFTLTEQAATQIFLPFRHRPDGASCLQSFSSVVGPNGSGKSNVIDAMLFVFGKKAKQVSDEKLSAPTAFPPAE